MTYREYKIPPLALLVTVLALAAGEVACGTGLYWVTMMSVTMLCIGLCYNMLGGLSKMSGIAFIVAGLWTIGISQFAKVLLRQPADSIINAPSLTITVYAVFFVSAVVGVSISSRLPLKLPHPLEPETPQQSRRLYWIALPLGVLGLLFFTLTSSGAQRQTGASSPEHTIGIALQGLALFAEVVAIDETIASSGGRRSLSFRALIPALAVMAYGISLIRREQTIEPILMYFVTCYTRGYRFRRRHIVAGAASLLLFVLVISPVLLFVRPYANGLPFRDRVHTVSGMLEHLNWAEVKAAGAVINDSTGSRLGDYYDIPNDSLLNRFSEIRQDSDLIAAGEHYHYGFATIKNDLLLDIPHFFYKNKPITNAANFRGVVAGEATGGEHLEPSFSYISDSFAGFGWMGVIAFGMVVIPSIFAIYEGMFDMSRPWGTIALLVLVTKIGEDAASTVVASVLILVPIETLVLSYGIGFLSRFSLSSKPRHLRTLPEESDLQEAR